MNPLLRAARTVFAVAVWPVMAVLDLARGQYARSLDSMLDWAGGPKTVYITREDPYDDGDEDA